jgi:isopentenyldiphosphate isomerase
MSQQEIFDVFDERMRKIGQASRKDVHAQGLWHQTFHCWVVNRAAEGGASLLLQLRHKDKDTFPGMLDISCAGHLLTGETVEDGVRELEEELGLTISFDELLYCGIVPQETVVTPQLTDREFNHIFIYECEKAVEEYAFQLSEISGLFEVGLNEFKRLVYGGLESIEAEGVVVVGERDEKWARIRRTIKRDDIVPQPKAYYDKLFGMLNENGCVVPVRGAEGVWEEESDDTGN